MESIENIIEKLKLKTNAEITFAKASEWSRLSVGGAPLFNFFPKNVEDLQIMLKTIGAIQYRTLGLGANVLIRDAGFDGIFIKMKNIRGISVIDCKIIAESGAIGSAITQCAIEHGIGGLEFLGTIPGTVGGLVKMNAGAHGSSIHEVVEWVEFLNEHGEIIRLTNQECKFEYRKSIFQNNWIILRACFQGIPTESAKIRELYKQMCEYRTNSQPTQGKLAGCFFKNPENIKAWELIKNSGLRTKNVWPSEKHANFITHENASAYEIECFIQMLQSNIALQTGIFLDREIEIIGLIQNEFKEV